MPTYNPLANPYIINPLELPANQTAAARLSGSPSNPTWNVGTTTQWCQSPFTTPTWGDQFQPPGSAGAQGTQATPDGRASVAWPDATPLNRQTCAQQAIAAEQARLNAANTANNTALTGLGNLVTGLPTGTGLTVTSGPHAGGTATVVNGTNLTGATAVYFGGVAQTLGAVTATTVAVTTKATTTTGPVDVVVVTPTGEVYLPKAFTFT